MSTLPIFPNYMQLQPRVPPAVWHVLRFLTMSGALGLCILLVLRPLFALSLWWGILVPSLPLVWFVAQRLSACCLEPSAPYLRFQPRPHGATLAERVRLHHRDRAFLRPCLRTKTDL